MSQSFEKYSKFVGLKSMHQQKLIYSNIQWRISLGLFCSNIFFTLNYNLTKDRLALFLQILDFMGSLHLSFDYFEPTEQHYLQAQPLDLVP